MKSVTLNTISILLAFTLATLILGVPIDPRQTIKTTLTRGQNGLTIVQGTMPTKSLGQPERPSFSTPSFPLSVLVPTHHTLFTPSFPISEPIQTRRTSFTPFHLSDPIQTPTASFTPSFHLSDPIRIPRISFSPSFHFSVPIPTQPTPPSVRTRTKEIPQSTPDIVKGWPTNSLGQPEIPSSWIIGRGSPTLHPVPTRPTPPPIPTSIETILHSSPNIFNGWPTNSLGQPELPSSWFSGRLVPTHAGPPPPPPTRAPPPIPTGTETILQSSPNVTHG